ncbi:MAG: hypothetical protein IKH78_07760 [Ruminococcus sp.]|nr:hypothetical protein [Ruminococcus sp.]
MKKLTSLAVRTFIYAGTACVVPLSIAAGYEIFRPKSVQHPMDYMPGMLICMIACANILLEGWLRRNRTEEFAIELN